jgi:hypothetical protein
MDNIKHFNLLLLILITLNFITLGWSGYENKLLTDSSIHFDPFSILDDIIILTDSLEIIISIYLLYTFKISNVFILSLLFYFIMKKFIEIFILLSDEKIQKTYQPFFLNINSWLKIIFFLVQLYILYFIFFISNKY